MEIILNPVPARVCVCAETREMTDEIVNYIKSFVTPVETRLFSVYRGDEIIGLMREMQNGFDLCILCGDLPGMPAAAVTELFQVMLRLTVGRLAISSVLMVVEVELLIGFTASPETTTSFRPTASF